MRTLRWIAGSTAVLLAAGLRQTLAAAQALQVTAASTAWAGLIASWMAAVLAALLVFSLTWTPWGRRAFSRVGDWARRRAGRRKRFLLLVLLFAFVLPALSLSPLPEPLAGLAAGFFWRAVIFWLAALAGAASLQLYQPESPFAGRLAAVVLVYALLHRAAMFLPDISAYPFSLGWSETSRYYYASLFLAEKIYGQAANPSVLHPTRYMLQAVPFLIGQLPLWAHRLWQVLLWLATGSAAAGLLARRMRLRGCSAANGRLLAMWAFLFLFQGPVWYHLLVMVIVILWGVDTANFRRTLLVVAAASVWAGMSRINWIPLPAAMAALLYFLETPRRSRSPVAYLAWPLAWAAAGGALGLFSQWAYAVLSGNALDQFASSFTSDLLWYRLLPSATYPLGVLPGIMLVSLPVFWGTVRRFRGRGSGIDPLRTLSIAGILFVFFAGGLVVSVKIGGGSNLHNLDGYIALLMTAGAYLFCEKSSRSPLLSPAILALAIAVPVGFAVATGGAFQPIQSNQAAAELAELKQLVELSSARGGEVLFIAERHLLAFDAVEGVDMVEDYEKVFLMEMAMAGNPDYLSRFERDLAGSRFSLIVTDIVRFNLQTRQDAFGEENNAWDRYVSYPLLCYYQEVQTLEAAGVEILAPKESPECPPASLDTTPSQP